MDAARSLSAMQDARQDISRAERALRPTVRLTKPGDHLRWGTAHYLLTGLALGAVVVGGVAWWMKRTKRGRWAETQVSGLEALGVD